MATDDFVMEDLELLNEKLKELHKLEKEIRKLRVRFSRHLGQQKRQLNIYGAK